MNTGQKVAGVGGVIIFLTGLWYVLTRQAQAAVTPGAPSAVRNLTAVQSGVVINISWDEPTDGAPFISYEIQTSYGYTYSVGTKYYMDRFTIPPGPVTYTVRAKNSKGLGVPAEVTVVYILSGPSPGPSPSPSPYGQLDLRGVGVSGVSGVAAPVPSNPPTAPQSIKGQIFAGQNKIQLTWAEPASPGSAPIAGYNIYRGDHIYERTDKRTVGPAALSYLGEGLTAGMNYFEVAAFNLAGEGRSALISTVI
jgi:hypothetical protein